MKKLLFILPMFIFASCGRVESPQELFDFLDHDKLENEVDALEKRIDELELSVNNLYLQIDDAESDQDILEQSIALINSNITSLQNNTTVKELIDPCGDNPSKFDEKLLVLSDGTIIAYFEHGNRRGLTDLVDGNYITTDSDRCHFSILNGKVSW